MPVSQKKKDGGRIAGPQNVPSTIEIRCEVILSNTKPSFFTLHGSYVTPPNIPNLAPSLFTALSSIWSTNLAPFMSTATSFTNVYVRDMASHTNPVSVGTGAAVSGTSASPAMPPEDAIVLTENVAARGRGLKGRIYLGGWATNADSGNGIIAPTCVTAITNFGTALFTQISNQSLTPAVAQVARNQYQGITGTTHAARNAGPVTVMSYTLLDNRWDAQRRRGQV